MTSGDQPAQDPHEPQGHQKVEPQSVSGDTEEGRDLDETIGQKATRSLRRLVLTAQKAKARVAENHAARADQLAKKLVALLCKPDPSSRAGSDQATQPVCFSADQRILKQATHALELSRPKTEMRVEVRPSGLRLSVHADDISARIDLPYAEGLAPPSERVLD